MRRDNEDTRQTEVNRQVGSDGESGDGDDEALNDRTTMGKECRDGETELCL